MKEEIVESAGPLVEVERLGRRVLELEGRLLEEQKRVMGVEDELCRVRGELETRTSELEDTRKNLQLRTERISALLDSMVEGATEKEKVELELRRQQEVLESIVEHIPVMLIFFDKNGGVRFLNREFEKTIGWSLEDGYKVDITEKCFPDRGYRREVRGFMLRAEPGWRDFKVLTRKGNLLESSWASVRLSDGSQIAIGIDTTARRYAEDRLRKTEERLRIIAETVEDVFWMRTPDSRRFEYVSPAYERVWKRDPRDLYDFPRAYLESIHPEDRTHVIAAAERSARGILEELEYRIILPDGSVRWIKDRSYPVTDRDGALSLVIGVATDVTRIKTAQEELRAYAGKLELLNRELQDFTFLASHDLREPLRKIQVFSSILIRNYSAALDSAGVDFLVRLHHSAARMSELIDAVLRYAKVTRGSRPFVRIDLNLVARQALTHLETLIESKGARVEVGDLPVVSADRAQMIQVFQNLISNGLKFHKPGEPPRIRVYPVADPGEVDKGAICIAFADQGIGFDEKYADRIFTPFEKLHAQDEFEGTGIGLAICRKIVEQHGGNIRVKAGPGKGAVFLVSIPESGEGPVTG